MQTDLPNPFHDKPSASLQSELMAATQTGDTGKARLLCEAGAIPHVLHEDWSALFLAVTRENPAMVQTLLPFADANIADSNWTTPLMIACANANIPAMAQIAALLVPRAQMDLRDDRFETAIDKLAHATADRAILDPLLRLVAGRDPRSLAKTINDQEGLRPEFERAAKDALAALEAALEADALSACAAPGLPSKAPRF